MWIFEMGAGDKRGWGSDRGHVLGQFLPYPSPVPVSGRGKMKGWAGKER